MFRAFKPNKENRIQNRIKKLNKKLKSDPLVSDFSAGVRTDRANRLRLDNHQSIEQDQLSSNDYQVA